MPVFFLYPHRSTTHAVDITAFRSRGGKYKLTLGFKLGAAVRPLCGLICEIDDASAVMQLSVVATPNDTALSLVVESALPITAGLPRLPRKSGKRAASADEGGHLDPESSSSSGESVLDCRGKISSASDQSSEPSVDTDLDEGLEVGTAPGKHCDASASDSPGPGGGSYDEQTEGGEHGQAYEEPIASAVPRVAPGTWKVWEGLWFDMTQNPAWPDVKISIKGPLRQCSTGLGVSNMSNTLTSWHFGETHLNPVRTMLLLRAWGIQRATRDGWCFELEGRMREQQKQISDLEADIRVAGGRDRPTNSLFGQRVAHKWLLVWVPDVVLRVCSG